MTLNRIRFAVLINLFKSINFAETSRLKDAVLTTHLIETSKHLKIDLSFDISVDCRKINRIDKH